MAFNFKKKMREFEQMKRDAPRVVGNMAKNHYLEGFQKGGFIDNTLDPWKKRKEGAPRNSGRAILVDTGALRRSIRVTSASFRRIVIASVGLKYASRHNQGLDGMPKRQFIGESRALTKKIKQYLKREIKSILR